jgi:hypothetical protein
VTGVKRTNISAVKELAWKRDGNCIRCTSHKTTDKNYPTIKRNGFESMSIARRILFRRHGVQPSNIVARHTCDNRWCINPDHILKGTHSDNAKDRSVRGRSSRILGSQNSFAKLTEDMVSEIRQMSRDGLAQQVIASIFRITRSNVSYIVSRKTWSHV